MGTLEHILFFSSAFFICQLEFVCRGCNCSSTALCIYHLSPHLVTQPLDLFDWSSVPSDADRTDIVCRGPLQIDPAFNVPRWKNDMHFHDHNAYRTFVHEEKIKWKKTIQFTVSVVNYSPPKHTSCSKWDCQIGWTLGLCWKPMKTALITPWSPADQVEISPIEASRTPWREVSHLDRCHHSSFGRKKLGSQGYCWNFVLS